MRLCQTFSLKHCLRGDLRNKGGFAEPHGTAAQLSFAAGVRYPSIRDSVPATCLGVFAGQPGTAWFAEARPAGFERPSAETRERE